MKKHDHAGLVRDLELLCRLESRRQALRFLAGASLLPIIGCGTSTTQNPSTTSSSGGSTSSGGSSSGGGGSSSGTPGACTTIPEETAGPFPGDGSNGANALTTSGVVRQDIRSSFGTMTGTAAGVLLTMELTLVNANASCAPLAGHAIYAWHCDKDGEYSLYTLTTQNYLRGVQETDANGKVSFTTIFPGAYLGRWPHVHFEIFPSLAGANSSANTLSISQLAFPDEACVAVYGTPGYEQSAINHPQTTLAGDGVFRDGAQAQLATMTGNVTTGYTASLTVGIAV